MPEGNTLQKETAMLPGRGFILFYLLNSINCILNVSIFNML